MRVLEGMRVKRKAGRRRLHRPFRGLASMAPAARGSGTSQRSALSPRVALRRAFLGFHAQALSGGFTLHPRLFIRRFYFGIGSDDGQKRADAMGSARKKALMEWI